MSTVLAAPPSNTKSNTAKERVYIHDEQSAEHQSDDVENMAEIKSCPACSKECQELNKCKQFANLTVAERWELVKDHKLCRSCLREHGFRCNRAKKCGMEECSKYHHLLLHPSKRPTEKGELSYTEDTSCSHHGESRTTLF